MVRLRTTAACSAAARLRDRLSSNTLTIIVRAPSQPGMLRGAILPDRRAAHACSVFACGVDRFYQRETAASLSPVAARRGVGLNGLEKVFQNRLVSSRIAD